MATLYEIRSGIENVQQGWTLTAAFSTDMNWIGLPGLMNDLFDITERNTKEYEPGSVGKIDNLYMLFVKESSYDSPSWEYLEESLAKLANKIKKKDIRKLAMPKICTGKGGFEWERVKELIEKTFADININIMICCG